MPRKGLLCEIQFSVKGNLFGVAGGIFHSELHFLSNDDKYYVALSRTAENDFFIFYCTHLKSINKS